MISGCSRFQTSGGSPNSRPLAMSIVPIAPSATMGRPGLASSSSAQVVMVAALCRVGGSAADRRAPPDGGGDDRVEPQEHRALEGVRLAVDDDRVHQEHGHDEGPEQQRAEDEG